MRIRDWINRNMGLGLLISLLLCGAGAALGAMLMDRELLAVESAGKWMAFMWLSASFAGCKVALQNVQQNRLPRRRTSGTSVLNCMGCGTGHPCGAEFSIKRMAYNRRCMGRCSIGGIDTGQ